MGVFYLQGHTDSMTWRRSVAGAGTCLLCLPALLAAPPALASSPAVASSPAQSSGPVVRQVQPLTVSTAAANSGIVKYLKQRVRNPRLGPDVAVTVADATTGQAIYSRKSLEGQLPASNNKLITAFVALKTMPATTRMVTKVVRSGQTSTIVIVGGGDPLLTREKLDSLAVQTAASIAASSAPVESVRVLYDDSLYAQPSRAPGWLGGYVPTEAVPVQPLSIHGFVSSAPSRDAARYFAGRLVDHGLQARMVGRNTEPLGSQLAMVRGYTLQSAVRKMLLYSDNNIAETLARNSALATGLPASWDGWHLVAHRQLRAAGVSMTGLAIRDGSGLSRSDRLTTRALTQVLRIVHTSTDPNLALIEPSLPIAGRTGTLSAKGGRFGTRPTACAAGKVFAKTGSIANVYSLSGYAIGNDGRERTFSLIANGVSERYFTPAQIREALDGLAATITGCY